MTAMPAAFIGHGSPMNALEDNPHTRAWRAFGAALPRPNAVLCVSAHWQTRGTAVTAMARPRTIHDFHGFPPQLQALEYPAPGAPALAARVRALLTPAVVTLDETGWGLDHGAWSVLIHLFPDANVPVVQLSLDARLSAPAHAALAGKLAPLREEGVLVLGSGNGVHNLREMNWNEGAAPFEWATRFNTALREKLESGDLRALADPETLGASGDAARCIPTNEHYLPLLYVAALRRPGEPVRILTDGIELGSIGMLSFALGG